MSRCISKQEQEPEKKKNERKTKKMLAIDFIPLLFGLAQLASASPLTRPASADVSLATLTVAESSTTAIAATTTTIQRPASSSNEPARNHAEQDQRDSEAPPQAQRRADFATSPASSTVAVAAATSTVTAAEDSFNDDSAQEAAVTTSKTQDSVNPATTAAPTDNSIVDADLAKEGYSELTYYSCEKYATATLCGWHEPVIYVGKTGGAARQGGQGGVAARPGLAAAGAVVCGAALNMMLGR